MSLRRLRDSEDGWVMVPVMILIVVALGVGLALLAVVDKQTQQSRAQRDVDSAQTLAEGIVSATTNVLAADQSSATWPATGACKKYTGDLTTAPAAGSTDLGDRIAFEVQSRFKGTSPDYAASTGRNTTWRVDLCPVQASDARWDDSFLTRAAGTPATKLSLWVRGQAGVRAPTATPAAGTRPVNSRAVVSKIRQSTATFTPPQDYAVGTGAFSTDVGVTLNSTLTSSLAGGLLQRTLGVQPLIKDTPNKIGVRCGLLNILHSTSPCLTGALAGLDATAKTLGLGQVTSLLGASRFQALPSWTMAPEDAIDAWREEAKATNTYYPASSPVTGYGSDRTRSTTGTPASCPSGSSSDAQVVFIEQVGDGDQYCNITGGKAKIFIVAKGAIRVTTGRFDGVVYALNKQECPPNAACSSADRASAPSREVVRIDAPGWVRGSVWADGAGGSVGIYPASSASPSKTGLLNIGPTSTGVCGLPGVGSLVGTLATALAGVGSLVGNTLAILGGNQQEEVRYPPGGSDGCSLLKSQLGALPTNDLVDLFGTSSTQQIVTSEHRTRNCTAKFLGLCTAWGPWSGWTARDTTPVALPALLPAGSASSLVDQLTGTLGSTLGSSYTAIEYDESARGAAASRIPQGAAPVAGSYRNVSSASG